MGDPHQAYLVARIPLRKPDGSIRRWKYVCVANVYHHNCDAVELMKNIRRFAILAKQPDNAEIIREELRLIGLSYTGEPLRGVPSRYLGRLLACAYNYCLEDETPSGPYNMLDQIIVDVDDPLWDEDNTEGLSIIDISDPERIAYCLVSGPGTFRGDEEEEEEQVGFLFAPVREPEHEPVLLSAEQFLRAWYPRVWRSLYKPDFVANLDAQPPASREKYLRHEQEILSTVALIGDLPYLDSKVLGEVWPKEFGKYHSKSGVRRPPASDRMGVPPLSDLLIGPVVEHVLRSGNLEDINSLILLPGHSDAILSSLKSWDSSSESPLPEHSIQLIVALLEVKWDGVNLDLSHLSLTEEQILLVAKQFIGTQTLKLCHNPFATIDVVEAVLKAMPSIKRLVLLDTPIDEEDWAKSMKDHPELFWKLNSLVHPCFLDMDEAFYWPAFSFMRFDQGTQMDASLPFVSNDNLVHTLTRIIRTIAIRNMPSVEGFLSTDGRDYRTNWEERHIPFFAQSVPKHLVFRLGWIFFLLTSYAGNQYGFIKPRIESPPEAQSERAVGEGTASLPSSSDPGGKSKASSQASNVVCDVYDIRGFLEELEKEGRPHFSLADKDALTELFAGATVEGIHNSVLTMTGKTTALTLISQEEAMNFLVPGRDRKFMYRHT